MVILGIVDQSRPECPHLIVGILPVHWRAGGRPLRAQLLPLEDTRPAVSG